MFHPQILLLNSRIHEEAAYVLYGENMFEWHISRESRPTRGVIDPLMIIKPKARLIKYFQLQVDTTIDTRYDGSLEAFR